MAWTGCVWFRTGKVASCCEHGSKPSGSVICWEFDCLRYCQLLLHASVHIYLYNPRSSPMKVLEIATSV